MKPASEPVGPVSPEYRQFVADLKARIGAAQLSAARAVNRDLILLYWDIGRAIVEKQTLLGWGESVVEQLARELRQAFPQMRGFPSRTSGGCGNCIRSAPPTNFSHRLRENWPQPSRGAITS